MGPVLAMIIMTITCFLSYVTATYLVEAVAVANRMGLEGIDRRDTVFAEEIYENP